MYEYGLRYSPQYEDDLDQVMNYVTYKLKNPDAAKALYYAFDRAIMERLPFAESFEPYHSRKDRENVYYRIYVGSYIIYYVVCMVEGKKTMEIRRLANERQDREKMV